MKDFAKTTRIFCRKPLSVGYWGVKLVGTDYLSIEKFHSGHHRTHLTLLRKNVVIIEGLNLSDVTPGDYELICLPLKIADGAGDGAPARVVLRALSDKE